MKKYEAGFTTKFQKWAKGNMPTGGYEIKHTRGKKRFPCKELKEHQLDALLAIMNGSFSYKIPDGGFSHKPFDVILFGDKAMGYIVIAYPTHFVIIAADMWPMDKISLTLEDAKIHATRVVLNKEL